MSTEIDDGNLVQTEGCEIGFDTGPELLRTLRSKPMTPIVALRPNLRHNHQLARIGIERFPE